MKNMYWLIIISGIIAAVLMFFLNPFNLDHTASKAVAVAVLMVIWWVTEALPMPVVSLLPLILLPLLGVSPIDEVSRSYSNPIIFLFMGGFMIGLAIEKWNLHKRIALQIVKRTGTSGDKIILGFIIATAFISMWLSNTATTMMMLPIALSVIAVFKDQQLPEIRFRNFSIVLMLVIAYASNFGGMATIIGTPPNAAFVGYIEKKYDYSIAFVDWMILCTPLAITLILMMYFILTKWLYPNRIKSSIEANLLINKELRLLGKLTTPEKRVLIVFLLTAIAWITRDLINKTGIIKLDDNMIAVAGAVMLFIIPNGKDITSENDKISEERSKNSGKLLDWKDTSKVAWGILLLFGGGIAIASALEDVGVMQQIGSWLAGINQAGSAVLILIIVVVSIFLSELMSNTAQVIVLSPVVVALADALNIDPLTLGIPMALSASAAAMLPMGTPPNAIIFSSGHVSMKNMLRAGFVMNLISIIVITLFSLYILPLVLSISN